ncbi:DinB family protein [Gorillibacterium sp. CAU 1737]|uniref:DinB family protein n=1 Tax=Gorillibacterium sp. CAU 1737 TaxID=3140362 RepID=UPI00326040A4
MLKLFTYNWQVREEWLTWCESLSEEELLKPRIGGQGSILRTLFHIIEVEYSWTIMLQGNADPGEPPFEPYASLSKVREYSAKCHETIAPFLTKWCNADYDEVKEQTSSGEEGGPSLGDVLRHMIAHEIHHVGQLSVWAREMGRSPVSADLIGRNL